MAASQDNRTASWMMDGPFVETKELIGGYAIFELRDMEEAVAAAREFMQLHLEHMPGWDGTCEVRVLRPPGVDGACEVGIRPRMMPPVTRRSRRR